MVTKNRTSLSFRIKFLWDLKRGCFWSGVSCRPKRRSSIISGCRSNVIVKRSEMLWRRGGCAGRPSPMVTCGRNEFPLGGWWLGSTSEIGRGAWTSGGSSEKSRRCSFTSKRCYLRWFGHLISMLPGCPFFGDVLGTSNWKETLGQT